MKKLFNKLIIMSLSYLPLTVVRLVAGRYVAGENIEDALKIVKALNKKGFSATVDILGEHTIDSSTARDVTLQYRNLLSNIHDQQLNCNISIKPSHLGLDISKECLYDNMSYLIETAKVNNNFIRIDMENSSRTDDSINLYRKCLEKYDKVGIVLQAYLFRSENDLIELENNDGINLRICKGIYRENTKIAIQGRQDINNNFLKLLKFAFKKNIYVAIATHDLSLIQEAYNLINDMNISKDKFEFQVLYGVPMSGWLEKHLEYGYEVRVYVPFGKDWYNYSVRRLKENPNIAFYILRDIFRR